MKFGVLGLVFAAVVVAPQLAHAEGREGLIRIRPSPGVPGLRVDGVFGEAPIAGTVIASDGPCTVRARAPVPGVSAGTITLTGTSVPITIEAAGPELRYAYLGPAFAREGEPIAVVATGGDFPVFGATVIAPPVLVGYTSPTAVELEGYTATWTPSAGTQIQILIAAFHNGSDAMTITCRVPDTGTFTVPHSTLALLPWLFDRAVVEVARIAESVVQVGAETVTIQVESAVTSNLLAIKSGEPARGSVGCACDTPRFFISLGLGRGGASRVGDAAAFSGTAVRLQVGQRLAHGLHLIEDFDENSAESLTLFDTSERQSSIAAGLRWSPFERDPKRGNLGYLDKRAFYVDGLVGAADRVRVTEGDQVSTWAPMASVAIGWVPWQGLDWSLGYEVREQVSRFDGQFQFGWQVLIVTHLNAF